MNVQSGGRQILLHGITFVLVGFVWGFVVHLTPYPRLALGAHLQFETNGMLLIVQAILLLKLPHRVGPKSVWVMVLAVWLTWAMALSQAANAWWGTTQILSIAASQAGATGGQTWQELLVSFTNIASGLGLLPAWTLLLAGFIKTDAVTESGDA